MPRLGQTFGAIYELARLGVISRFNYRGRWWSWRWSTAFGHESNPSPSRRRHELLEFGRWVRRIRRFM